MYWIKPRASIKIVLLVCVIDEWISWISPCWAASHTSDIILRCGQSCLLLSEHGTSLKEEERMLYWNHINVLLLIRSIHICSAHTWEDPKCNYSEKSELQVFLSQLGLHFSTEEGFEQEVWLLSLLVKCLKKTCNLNCCRAHQYEMGWLVRNKMWGGRALSTVWPNPAKFLFSTIARQVETCWVKINAGYFEGLLFSPSSYIIKK